MVKWAGERATILYRTSYLGKVAAGGFWGDLDDVIQAVNQERREATEKYGDHVYSSVVLDRDTPVWVFHSPHPEDGDLMGDLLFEEVYAVDHEIPDLRYGRWQAVMCLGPVKFYSVIHTFGVGLVYQMIEGRFDTLEQAIAWAKLKESTWGG